MKILIADDDRVSREFLLGKLRSWGDEVLAVGDGRAALDILTQPDAPQMAVLDWMMPELDGPDVCREVRRLAAEAAPHLPPGAFASNHRAYTYLLIVTAHGRTGDLVKGLEAGADDYLIKPINPHELRARVSETGRRILRLQEELLTAQATLREKASRDALTGLWNRGTVLEMLTHELALRDRTGAPVSVLLADLDHFKRVNDTRGHQAGDAVLREAAQRMHGAVRVTDWVGRYGGEEFLVVLPGCDHVQARNLAERVRGVLAADPVRLPDGDLPVTASIGVNCADGEWQGDATQLLHIADEALYRAKAKGRNRVELAVPEDTVVMR